MEVAIQQKWPKTALPQLFTNAKVEVMRPPLIVLIPWVLSLVLEFWLMTLLIRRKLYREVPTFSAFVFIYSVIDLVVLATYIDRFYPYPMFTLREIASAVLRTWLLIALCRQLLQRHVWTKWLMVAILLFSATLLVGIGFPAFLEEHVSNGTYLHLGVWFRTAYFTQVGVIAVLFLMNFNSLLSSFNREMGIAMGLATMSAAELVSMTLRARPGGGGDASLVSLNYIGMFTAFAIWLMFMSPRISDRVVKIDTERAGAATARYMASGE